MKNLVLSFLLAAFCLNSYSQKKKDPSEKESLFRWGFKGGLNLNKIEGQSFKNEFSYNYALGGFMQVNITRKLGIQPEINFVQTSAEQSDDITDIYDDLFLDGEQKKAKLDYLKFAGLLNIDIGPSQRVKLQLGPQWGMLLDEAVDSLKSPQDVFKKGEFSVLSGIMLQLPLIHIGTRYEIGLTNINGIDNQDQWKSQAWQFFVGITL
ncbi:MAG TPA: porin family protein [Chitinophagaceae bacterium]|nr:porin family protein [Chitinophagaceae bacterium]